MVSVAIDRTEKKKKEKIYIYITPTLYAQEKKQTKKKPNKNPPKRAPKNEAVAGKAPGWALWAPGAALGLGGPPLGR